MKDNEHSLRDLWNTTKQINIDILGVLEREKETERIYKEIMPKNFQNLMKYMNIDIQKAQQTPNKMNSKTHTETHHTETFERQRIFF